MSEKDKNEDGGEEDEMDKFKNLSVAMREEIEECFEIFDKDKDQHINYSDLGMLLRWLKFNPTDKELKQYVEKYDQSKSMLINKKLVYEIVD